MAAQLAGFLHRPDQWETGTRADGGPPRGEGGNCVFLSPQAFFPSFRAVPYLFLYSATCFSCLDSQNELPLVNTD